MCGDPFLIRPGAAEAGTGCSCLMRPGFWSSFNNQGLLAGIKAPAFGINYENRFGIKELGRASAAALIPAGKSSLGVIFSSFGYSDLRRYAAGISSGIKITRNISAGLQIDYFSEKTAGEYNDRRTLTFEAGLLLKPSENVSVGFHLFNPVPNSLRRSFLPSSLSAGAGIKLNSSLVAMAETELTTGTVASFRTGFDYSTQGGLRLRGGFNSRNTSFCFGLGYLIKSTAFDIAFSTHERLGLTTSASVIFEIK